MNPNADLPPVGLCVCTFMIACMRAHVRVRMCVHACMHACLRACVGACLCSFLSSQRKKVFPCGHPQAHTRLPSQWGHQTKCTRDHSEKANYCMWRFPCEALALIVASPSTGLHLCVCLETGSYHLGRGGTLIRP